METRSVEYMAIHLFKLLSVWQLNCIFVRYVQTYKYKMSTRKLAWTLQGEVHSLMKTSSSPTTCIRLQPLSLSLSYTFFWKMETNPPSIGKYEQIVSNSDEQGTEEQVQAYTCTFCKKGFSNAQALGGHMNIHRKDRAKLLRQTEDERLLLSVDMVRKNPLIHPQPSADKLSQLESTDQDKDCSLKRPLTLSGEGNTGPPGMEKLHQLSLFSEKPSQSNDQRARCYGGGHEEKIRHSQKELDLELRLGPEPP